MNIKFVLLTLVSVIFSIVISISVSQFLYGGIELVMIIMPAIIFIVCVSDLMHLINDANIKFDNKKDFFKQKVKKIGVPVALTSLTTAIGFLSFCFSDVLPITRFGLITTIGIIISLFIILVSYSICVDLNFHKLKGNLKINKLIDTFIYNITHIQSKLKYYSIIFIMILIAVYGIQKVEVDNYLTDEVNKKSSLFKEMSFFNNNFGGIKPVTFKTSVDDKTEINQLLDFENFLLQKEFSLDFSLTRMLDNPELVSKSVLKKITKDSYKMQTRMNDQGSKKSFQIFEQIKRGSRPLANQKTSRRTGDKLVNKSSTIERKQSLRDNPRKQTSANTVEDASFFDKNNNLKRKRPERRVTNDSTTNSRSQKGRYNVASKRDKPRDNSSRFDD